MQYSYNFGVILLVIFLAFSCHARWNRQLKTVRSKIFGMLLGVCLGGGIANVLLCIGLANAAIVPVIWNELFAFAFFALEGAAFYLMFRYMEEMCGFSGAAGRLIRYLGKVPFFFFEIMLLATPWTGFFFDFKDGAYAQGVYAWVLYVYIGYYFFINLCMMIYVARKNPSAYAGSENGTNGEKAVECAITEKNFQVYYQPIYSLKEKCVVSLEALVRLKDEKSGFIPPDEFIPLAEKNGTIMQISEIVLEECCRFLAKHVLANPSLGIQTIHVNIAAAQCLNRNLKESILPVLEHYHVPAHMITLELPERTVAGSPKLMLWHMREFGKAGMGFAIDGYGSGNLNCFGLLRFPVQEIKIGKEMTWSYFEDPAAKIVIENEIKTIQKLGFPIVVVGVENKEQSDALEALGVDMIQGFYYGKPMPEVECLRYIRRMHSAKEEYGKGY